MFKGGFIVSGAEVNLASDTSPQTPYVPLMDRGSLGSRRMQYSTSISHPRQRITRQMDPYPSRARTASITFFGVM